MKALRITVEGIFTSFRYPHFVQGVHPTFEMPPPATIYGHICSTVGEFIPPNYTRFAYHFRYETKLLDYEHLHFFGDDGAKMNPFNRELLYNPRLTLYLDQPDLMPYFLSPHYAVVLGRSQDLMTYTDIKVVELEKVAQAFYEHTLVSLTTAPTVDGIAYSVTMPKFIDANRQPIWGQYAVIKEAVVFPNENTWQFEGQPPMDIWIDPEVRSPQFPKLSRGIMWHSWT